MLSSYLLLSVIAGILYTLLMVYFISGWLQLKNHTTPKNAFSTKVSVIVPVYNGQNSIADNLGSLLQQKIQTHEFEIIVVNDYSTDNTVDIILNIAKKNSRVNIINNKQKKGKKQALAQAIEQSRADLIVITDSDCTYSPYWLASIVSYYEQHNPNMIIGPVAINQGKTLINKFQQLDTVSLSATSGAAAAINHPIMCSAANLAFKKQIYKQITNPFNTNYISGDDMFLMHNFKKIDANKIHFLKNPESIVYTMPAGNYKKFIKQRTRWASKTKGYTDTDTKFTAIIVAYTCTILVLGLLLIPFKLSIWKPVASLFVVKLIADTIFFTITAPFYNIKNNLKLLPIFELFYPCYVVNVILISFRKKQIW